MHNINSHQVLLKLCCHRSKCQLWYHRNVISWISTKGVFILEKTPRLQPSQRSASVSWDNFNFCLHEKLLFRFARINMSRGGVLKLVQFDFSYSSAIITLNSTFILSLSASKSNPIKTISVCKLRCNLS